MHVQVSVVLKCPFSWNKSSKMKFSPFGLWYHDSHFYKIIFSAIFVNPLQHFYLEWRILLCFTSPNAIFSLFFMLLYLIKSYSWIYFSFQQVNCYLVPLNWAWQCQILCLVYIIILTFYRKEFLEPVVVLPFWFSASAISCSPTVVKGSRNNFSYKIVQLIKRVQWAPASRLKSHLRLTCCNVYLFALAHLEM